MENITAIHVEDQTRRQVAIKEVIQGQLNGTLIAQFSVVDNRLKID